MKCLSVFDQEYKTLERHILEEGSRKDNQLTIIPHSGLMIPESLINFFYTDKKTMNEIFKDGDPWLDLLEIEESKNMTYLLHRDSGDPNRETEDNYFIRKKSFDRFELHESEITEEAREEAKRLVREYTESIGKRIEDHKRRYLLVPHIHSMEPTTPRGHKHKLKRPDINLVFGEGESLMPRKVQRMIEEQFYENFQGYSIKTNEPFYKGGYLLQKFSDYNKGVVSFNIEINKGIYMNDKNPVKKEMSEISRRLNETFYEIKKEL
ncbi:MAG: N-formylglutamate amidohydrolase [Nanobdellota archaeon]